MSFLAKWKLRSADRRAEKLIAGIEDSKIQDEIVRMGDAAVPALRQTLGAPDEKTRRSVLYCLYCIGTPAARDATADALNDESADVRYGAATGLGALRDLRSLETLLDFFHTGKPEQRRSAAQYLGCLGDMRALEPLRSFTGLGDGKLKGFVSDAIERIRMRSEQPDRGTRAIARMKDLGRKILDKEMLPYPDIPLKDLIPRWRVPKELFSKFGNTLTCDICSRDFPGDDQPRSLKIPAGLFRDEVKYGYNPVLSALDPRRDLDFWEDMSLAIPGTAEKRAYLRKAVEGIDAQGLESYYRFWKEMAMKSTTDWALCPRCANDFALWWLGEETWNEIGGR
ncbi:MAG: HEAT repeat domain-containing protein [Candidatus Aminicenantales bacterium]